MAMKIVPVDAATIAGGGAAPPATVAVLNTETPMTPLTERLRLTSDVTRPAADGGAERCATSTKFRSRLFDAHRDDLSSGIDCLLMGPATRAW